MQLKLPASGTRAGKMNLPCLIAQARIGKSVIKAASGRTVGRGRNFPCPIVVL